MPKRENVRAKKQDILYDKTTGGSSPVPSCSQPLRIFNLTQSCVLCMYMDFLHWLQSRLYHLGIYLRANT